MKSLKLRQPMGVTFELIFEEMFLFHVMSAVKLGTTLKTLICLDCIELKCY